MTQTFKETQNDHVIMDGNVGLAEDTAVQMGMLLDVLTLNNLITEQQATIVLNTMFEEPD